MTREQKIERIRELVPPWDIDGTINLEGMDDGELDRALKEAENDY